MMHASHEAMLVRRVEDAEHRAAALQYLLDEMTAVPPRMPKPAQRLTATERRILGALLRHPGAVLDDAQITAAGKAHTPLADWPGPLCAKVHICHIRRKLTGTGVTIHTHHGIGYSATWEEPA